MTGLVYVGFAAVVVWTVRAWFWPLAPCRKCDGTKTNSGSTHERFGQCKRCKGSGMRQVLGSRMVHRAVRAALGRKGKR
jgi:hypothetical protein